MTVLELARKAGIPPSVVRFYARTGTLRPHRLHGDETGYDGADAERLRLLVGLHRAGIIGTIGRQAESRGTGDGSTGSPAGRP